RLSCCTTHLFRPGPVRRSSSFRTDIATATSSIRALSCRWKVCCNPLSSHPAQPTVTPFPPLSSCFRRSKAETCCAECMRHRLSCFGRYPALQPASFSQFPLPSALATRLHLKKEFVPDGSSFVYPESFRSCPGFLDFTQQLCIAGCSQRSRPAQFGRRHARIPANGARHRKHAVAAGNHRRRQPRTGTSAEFSVRTRSQDDRGSRRVPSAISATQQGVRIRGGLTRRLPRAARS